MQCNVGGWDRVIRMILGAIIMAVGVYFQSWWGVVGLVIFLSGWLRVCFAYKLFGFSTATQSDASRNASDPRT